MKILHSVATVGVLAVVATCSGCAGSGSPQSGASVNLEESALIPGAYANPLDPIMFPDENQSTAIVNAEEALLTDCMAAAGYTYVKGDGVQITRTAEDAQYTYTSVSDPDVAAQYGFHSKSWIDEIQNRRIEAVPDGYDDALVGNPNVDMKNSEGVVIATYDPESCQGKARDAIDPGWAEADYLNDLGSDILYKTWSAVQSDSDVAAKQAAWSRCMGESGYNYETPEDPMNDESYGELPTASEIPIAISSANCMHSSGLLRAESRVWAQATQVELDKHPGLVARWLELKQSAVDALNGSGAGGS